VGASPWVLAPVALGGLGLAWWGARDVPAPMSEATAALVYLSLLIASPTLLAGPARPAALLGRLARGTWLAAAMGVLLALGPLADAPTGVRWMLPAAAIVLANLWVVLATAPASRRDTWTVLGLIATAWLLARWPAPIELRYGGFIAVAAIVLAVRLGPASLGAAPAALPRGREGRRIAPLVGAAYTAALLADEIVRWLQWAGAPAGPEREAAAHAAALLPLAAISALPGALVLLRLGERTRGAREAYAAQLAGNAPLAALELARRAWQTQTRRALIELATVQAIATLLALAAAPAVLASWGLGPAHAAAFDAWLLACGLQILAAAVLWQLVDQGLPLPALLICLGALVLGIAGSWLAAPVVWPAWPAVLWAAVLALAAGALRAAQGSLDRRMLMPSASDLAA
jgi:hypothetical protein